MTAYTYVLRATASWGSCDGVPQKNPASGESAGVIEELSQLRRQLLRLDVGVPPERLGLAFLGRVEKACVRQLSPYAFYMYNCNNGR